MGKTAIRVDGKNAYVLLSALPGGWTLEVVGRQIRFKDKCVGGRYPAGFKYVDGDLVVSKWSREQC